MTYKGHVQDGLVVLDEPAELPEGTQVSVRPLKQPRPNGKRDARIPTLADRLRPFIGCLKGLPSDLSMNHDHYLHGAPKRT